jgi:hypothetical protein
MGEPASRPTVSAQDPHAELLSRLRLSDPIAQSQFFDQVAPGVIELLNAYLVHSENPYRLKAPG